MKKNKKTKNPIDMSRPKEPKCYMEVGCLNEKLEVITEGNFRIVIKDHDFVRLKGKVSCIRCGLILSRLKK